MDPPSEKSCGAQLIGELIQLAQKLRSERNALALVSDPLGVTLFAGQPNAIHIGKPARVAEHPDQRIDVAFERFNVTECLERDGDDRLPRVGWRAIVLVEVDRVMTIRRAVERPGKQAENQCEAVALVTADRQEKTLIRARRISERLALTVDHPSFG